MSENLKNVIFRLKKAPAAAKKTSPGLLLVKTLMDVIFSQSRCLQQLGRPYQDYYMSKLSWTSFLVKQGACSSREDLTKTVSCKQFLGTFLLARKRVPAAAGKTSIGKILGRSFWRKRKAPAAAGRTSPRLTNSQESHFGQKKRLWQLGRPHQAKLI